MLLFFHATEPNFRASTDGIDRTSSQLECHIGNSFAFATYNKLD